MKWFIDIQYIRVDVDLRWFVSVLWDYDRSVLSHQSAPQSHHRSAGYHKLRAPTPPPPVGHEPRKQRLQWDQSSRDTSVSQRKSW